MRATRRGLAALLLALGLLPSVDRALLAHAHHGPAPLAGWNAAGEADAPGGPSGCAACQARATLDAVAIDAHPERHGLAPTLPPAARPCTAPVAPRLETPPVRGPPLQIV